MVLFVLSLATAGASFVHPWGPVLFIEQLRQLAKDFDRGHRFDMWVTRDPKGTSEREYAFWLSRPNQEMGVWTGSGHLRSMSEFEFRKHVGTTLKPGDCRLLKCVLV